MKPLFGVFNALRAATPFIIVLLLFVGCETSDKGSEAAADTAARAEPASGDAVEGVEKVKPAPGTGNVQGQVLYNGKPAAGIEVTLCEEFNRFGSGCGGQTFTAVTDAGGEYVITGVAPKEYGALLAKVFDTEGYVFATSGITGLSSESYKVEDGRTLFVRPTNLFKSDLKISSPKAGSTASAAAFALAWDPYPDASYYKLSLFPDSATVTSPYISHRVDSNAFAATRALVPGEYRIEVEAYNGNDIKLAESSDDITVNLE